MLIWRDLLLAGTSSGTHLRVIGNSLDRFGSNSFLGAPSSAWLAVTLILWFSFYSALRSTYGTACHAILPTRNRGLHWAYFICGLTTKVRCILQATQIV